MKVLIIDSSKEIIKRLEELLAESGSVSKIYKTSSYKDGFRIIKDKEPETIILGVNLHSEDAINSVTEIVNYHIHASIILLTNSEQEMEEIRNRYQYAIYYLDKYHEFERILAIIHTIANKKKNT